MKAQDKFYRDMETLNSPNARRFMDKIEWVQDNGQSNGDNGRFGTNGMRLLSNTSVDDELRWKAVGLEHLSRDERQAMINAARDAVDSEYLDSVHGGDGVFEPNDISAWLGYDGHKQWKRADLDGPSTLEQQQTAVNNAKAQDKFYRDMETLNSPNARRFMDKIEWVQDNGQSNGDNGRFGTNGMRLLSNTSVDDELRWKAVGLEHLSRDERQAMINAARDAVDSEYLDSVHGGDGVFEPNDISAWLGYDGHKQWKIT